MSWKLVYSSFHLGRLQWGRFATGHETHFCYAMSLQGFGYGDVVHQLSSAVIAKS